MKRMALVRWALVSGVSFAALAVACGGDDDAAIIKSPSGGAGAAGTKAGAGAAGASGSSATAGAAGASTAAGAAGAAGTATAGAAGAASGGAAGQSAAGAAGEAAAGASAAGAGAAGAGDAGAAGDGSATAGAAGDGSSSAGAAGDGGGAAGAEAGGAAGDGGGTAGADAGGAAGFGGKLAGGFGGAFGGFGGAAGGAGGASAGAAGAAGGTGIDLALLAACKKVAEAECEKQEECLAGQVTRTFGANGDAACVDAVQQQCFNEATAPGSKTQASDELACASATQQASCLQWRSPGPLTKCIPVKGTKPLGSTCSFDTQCGTGNCLRAIGSNCGNCAAMPQANASCQQATGCGPQPLVCAASGGFAAQDMCVTPGGAGTSCKDDLRCDAGFGCEGNQFSKSCVALTTAGGNCTGNNSRPCDVDSGLTCKPGVGVLNPGKCEAAALANAGQGCGPTHQDALCTGGTSCVGGTCVADATTAGAACHPTQGPFCRAPLDCLKAVGGTYTCQELKGDSCKLVLLQQKAAAPPLGHEVEASSFWAT